MKELLINKMNELFNINGYLIKDIKIYALLEFTCNEYR